MLIHRLAAAGFSTFVLGPIRLGHGILGERIWPPLETVAKAMGKIGGTAARPIFGLVAGKKGPLEALLAFTTVVEGTLGIEGTNEVLDERTARRRVTQCPFADSLGGTTGFCTRLGWLAGVTSCESLAPGSRFEIRTTLSQGHACCEYIYEIGNGPGETAHAG